MKKNLVAAIAVIALAVPTVGNAQFGSLLGGAAKPATANGGADLNTQQDSLVRNYLAAGKDVLTANDQFANALGIKAKSVNDAATSDSLSGKDVEAQDKAISAQSETLVQELKSGATLKDSQAKATYTKGLISMATGMKKYLELRKDAQGFSSSVSSASPLMLGKLQSGFYVAKNLPTSMANLGNVLKSAVDFGRSNGVEIPKDATSVL